MRRGSWIAAAGLAVAVAGGIAAAASDGDTEQELTGSTRERAVAAALAATGDDGAAYGIEAGLADGRQVEVELDEAFEVVAQEPDDDTLGEDRSR